MHTLMALLILLAVLAPEGDATAVLESAYSPRDFDLIPDPARDEWAKAPRVGADRDYLGRELRIGLYRIAVVEPEKHFYAWRPTGRTTFHEPKAFGTLRLR
jgi:hypothetical protein